MDKIKTKARKMQYEMKHKLLSLNNVVLAVAVCFCLVWTWGAISSMSRNWSLAEKVASSEREQALLELEVETLELENNYYRSEEYQELAARKYRNKILPGETMIYLPKNSDEATHKYDDNETAEDSPTTTKSNFEQWMAFLFGI